MFKRKCLVRGIRVVFVLLLSIIASTAVFAGGTEEAGIVEGEPMVLTFLTMGDWSEWENNTTYVESVIEPMFNVDMQVIKINAWDGEKYAVTLAAGDIPDMMVKWGAQDAFDDGLIQAIDMDLVEQYMPGTKKRIDEMGGAYAWDISTDPDTGELFQVPCISAGGLPMSSIHIRKDWLDNVGISKLPSTIEELHDIAYAFTYQDPDNNGKNDTYGFSSANSHTNYFLPNVQAAYGTHHLSWLEEDGSVAYGAVTEAYKDFLRTISLWYAEGLVEPSYADTKQELYAKFVAGQIGIENSNIQYLSSASPSGLYSAFMKDPNVEIAVSPSIIGPEGHSGAFTYGPVFGWGMMFGVNTSEEKVVKIMQIQEKMINDFDLWMMSRWGEKNVDFTIEESGKVKVSSDAIPSKHGGMAFSTHDFSTFEELSAFLGETLAVQAIEDWENVRRITDVINVGRLNKLVSDDFNVDMTAMKRIVDEFTIDFMIGTKNVDSADWDEYVKSWMDAGGKIMTNHAQTLPRLN